MALNNVEFPYAYTPYFDKGKPIYNGYIYIGEPDLDPAIFANQKVIYFVQEDGSQVLGAQPVRTGAGGVPTYNGAPIVIKVDGDYSIKLLNSSLSQVYYSPNGNVSSAILGALQTVATLAELQAKSQSILTVNYDGSEWGVLVGDYSAITALDVASAVYAPIDGAASTVAVRKRKYKVLHTDFWGVLSGTGTNQLIPMQKAYNFAAYTGEYLDHPQGTILMSSSGSAFDGDFELAANEACIKIGSQTIDDTKNLRIGCRVGDCWLKPMTANGVAVPLVVENINVVDIQKGMNFDGNLTTSTATAAHAFAIVGCKRTNIWSGIRLENFRSSRVSGSRQRSGLICTFGDIFGRASYGSGVFFPGKPYGVEKVIHSGTVYIDGTEGDGQGGITVDNDPIATTDLDQTPSSITAVGNIVTVDLVDHGYEVGEVVYTGDADQGPYNGSFYVATVPDADSYTYTARQAPASSPATGTLVVRKAGSPIRRVEITRSVAERLTSDNSMFALKLEDSVERYVVDTIEAVTLNEASASTSLGAFRFGPGITHWPLEYGVIKNIVATDTYSAADVVMGRANYGTMNYNNILGRNLNIGFNCGLQNTVTTDHGYIENVTIGDISMRGKWAGNDRSYPLYISNDASRVVLIKNLTAKISELIEGGAGIALINGVDRVDLDLGTIDGGFSIGSTANIGGSFASAIGTLCIVDANSVKIKVGYVDGGGNGLASGKPGSVFEIQAFNDITIHGGVVSGGEGNDQVLTAALQLTIPTTVADQNTLCQVNISDMVFRNLPRGINTDDPSGIGAGNGYALNISDTIFEDTVDDVWLLNPSRLVRLNAADVTDDTPRTAAAAGANVIFGTLPANTLIRNLKGERLTVSTTDATTAELIRVPVPLNTVGEVTVIVTGVSSTGDTFTKRLKASFSNTAGTAVLRGDTSDSAMTATAWTATIVAAGPAWKVQVTGEAAKNIKWSAKLDYTVSNY
jgi:hypothetical protein